MHPKSWFSFCLLGQAALAVAFPQEPTTAAATSKTLPPSPTGSGACEPHGDHWHCHPTSTASHDDHDHDHDHDHDAPSTAPLAQSTDTDAHPTASGSCVPHKDHWHCPSGVSKPATPPAQSTAASTCEPHNDHWHCPSGVPKPTTPPPGASTYTKSGTKTTGATTSPPTGSAPTDTAKPTANGVGARPAVPFGAAAAVVSLFGAFFVGALAL